MSYYFDPINILDTSNSKGLGSGGSMTISGGISVGRDTFIGGNLAISGTATSFSDNILLINSNPSVTSDTGLLFQRYSNDITNNQNYSSIIYKESDDEFVFGYIQNEIQKELNSFSGYTALKANNLTLVSTNNSSFSESGSLNVLGGIKINKDTYLLGKMYITDSIVFNTTGNNQSNIELESTQSLYIGSNKAHIQVNGNDTLNNPGHIELAFNTYMSFNYKSNGQNQDEILRISTSGNIGIGTTSPNYKLHIQGDINVTGDIYKDGSVFSGSSQWESIGTDIVYTSGNVGVNTTVPNANLEVNGSLFASSGTISQLQVTNVTSGVLLSNTSLVALGNSNTLGSLITTGGNVGVGVVPNAKGQLHISSNTSTNLIISGATYNPSGAIGILFQSDDLGSLNNVARYKTQILAVGDGYYGQSDLHFVLNNDYDVNDATLADTRMVIKKDGSVGIGTVEPNAKLTVFNATNTDTSISINAGGENNSASLFFGTPFEGNLNNALKTAIIAQGSDGWSRNDLHFCLNDNNNSNDNTQNASLQHARMTIKNTGNVGIGTTDPSRKFHIEGPAASTLNGPHILITNSGNPFPLFQLNNWSNDNIALNFDMYWDGSTQRSSSSTGSFQIAKVASQLQFNVANANPGNSISPSTAMCIGSTGNIGIGSSSPIAKIDIVGGSQNTGVGGNPILAFQYFDGGYRHFIKSRHNSVLTFDNGNAIDIYLNKSVNVSDSTAPGTGNSLALSITGAGVGIGTSTPTSNLVVFANGISIFDPLTSTIAEFRGSTTSSTPETILRLGRGHSSGIAHAASAEFQVYRAYTNDVSANSGLNIKLGSLSNDNADKSVMTLIANGNVGIGTTVPNANLDVNGSMVALSATVGTLLINTSLSAIGDSNTLGNLFTSGGNVGIGTTEPSTLLHVNGEIFCNSLVSPSDERLKKDIALVETENCYNLVKNIPLKQYRWNTEMHNIHVPRNDTRLGWIAQDLEESFPQSVEHFSAYGITDCRTINMDQLIAVMYGTIQELQKKVEQLEQDNSNYYLNGR